MGLFGRVGNLISGYISSKRESAVEAGLKEAALEAELKKSSPAVKQAAKERLAAIKKTEASSKGSSESEEHEPTLREPPKPKKRTL